MELKDPSDGCFKDKLTGIIGKQTKDLNDLENQTDFACKSDKKDNTSGSKVVVVNENDDLDRGRNANTKCQSDKCVRIYVEDCSDESADESSKVNNDKHEEDGAEMGEEIIMSCQDECKEFNENTVTLRRKKTSFATQVKTNDEDYRYLECLSTKAGTSRRMVEIGSETLISDDVRIILCLNPDIPTYCSLSIKY